MITKRITRQCLLAAALVLSSTSVLAMDSLKVALIPSEDSRAMLRQTEALMDKLSEKLDTEVTGFVATDYNGVIEALRAGHVDIAYLGPFSYVKATEVANVEAFAVAETKKAGSVAYHSQIIARAEADDINELKDLKGKNVAFVDPTSTSGYVFPMVGLKAERIDPTKDFRNVVYTGAHDANILAVKHGRVDAATVADRIVDAAVEKGLIGRDEYKVIWRSSPIPESPMVWRNNLPEKSKKRIREAFLSMESVQFGDQGIVNRYMPTNDEAYDIVRKAAKM